MTTPKKKLSRSRVGMSRSHMALSLPNLGLCPQCHNPRPPHRVCPHCGYYARREVIPAKKKAPKK